MNTILNTLVIFICLSTNVVFGDPIPCDCSSMGAFSTFGILANTYANTAGTTINYDLGFNTPPALSPEVTGTTYTGGLIFNQAGFDQSVKLDSLNELPCTYTFGLGAIDLSTDVGHGLVGVYTPNVYCMSGAVTIGLSGISLSGNGTYVFRTTGALTNVAQSHVELIDGATACDIWWTPGGATTLSLNSTFAGNIIDNFGITLASDIIWTGRALSFNGTISTYSDTITVPYCTPTTSSPSNAPTPSSSNAPTPSTSNAPTSPSSNALGSTNSIGIIMILCLVFLFV